MQADTAARVGTSRSSDVRIFKPLVAEIIDKFAELPLLVNGYLLGCLVDALAQVDGDLEKVRVALLAPRAPDPWR